MLWQTDDYGEACDGPPVGHDDALRDSNRAVPSAGGARNLTKLLNFMKPHLQLTAMIQGFTERQGIETGNYEIR
ncbi:hypothetical protein [Rhizobacter sp. Root16D2]|uniref:hypothetical protein n=1 Tax=Rhizobacter sp. Root16D2 TaxID=1736479 RepID=UPI0006FC00F5|nr:hypothetical protein [Rhizobacter sp. Root16D2]KRB14684.1 hypothetical protein ASE08_09675 [Rhizobacter sp. Root16D2]